MRDCCRTAMDLGLNYCGTCTPRVVEGEVGSYYVVEHPKTFEERGIKHAVTVGRRKRKRKKGAGSGVKIKNHTRSPRGSNKGKKRVRVDSHKRGKPPKKGRRRKR